MREMSNDVVCWFAEIVPSTSANVQQTTLASETTRIVNKALEA